MADEEKKKDDKSWFESIFGPSIEKKKKINKDIMCAGQKVDRNGKPIPCGSK